MRSAVFLPMPGNLENSCTASSINLDENIMISIPHHVLYAIAKIPDLGSMIVLHLCTGCENAKSLLYLKSTISQMVC
jgi:hypothetical protein